MSKFLPYPKDFFHNRLEIVQNRKVDINSINEIRAKNFYSYGLAFKNSFVDLRNRAAGNGIWIKAIKNLNESFCFSLPFRLQFFFTFFPITLFPSLIFTDASKVKGFMPSPQKALA